MHAVSMLSATHQFGLSVGMILVLRLLAKFLCICDRKGDGIIILESGESQL